MVRVGPDRRALGATRQDQPSLAAAPLPRQTPEVGAACGSSACLDLSGGRRWKLRPYLPGWVVNFCLWTIMSPGCRWNGVSFDPVGLQQPGEVHELERIHSIRGLECGGWQQCPLRPIHKWNSVSDFTRPAECCNIPGL